MNTSQKILSPQPSPLQVAAHRSKAPVIAPRMRRRRLVLSRGVKILSTVLLSPLVVGLVWATLSKPSWATVAFTLVAAGLPLFVIWWAPTPGSNRAAQMVPVRAKATRTVSATGAGLVKGEPTSDPFFDTDHPDAVFLNPMYEGFAGNIWNRAGDD